MSNLAIYRHPKGPIPIIHLDESCPATRTNGVPCICPKESPPSHVDIVPSLFAATKAADAEQQADDVIGRQQSQRQRWVDRLDAAMESGLEADELWTVVRSDKPLCDWTVSWAVDRRLDGVDVSDMYANGKRTVSVYIGSKTLIIVSERIDTTGQVSK